MTPPSNSHFCQNILTSRGLSSCPIHLPPSSLFLSHPPFELPFCLLAGFFSDGMLAVLRALGVAYDFQYSLLRIASAAQLPGADLGEVTRVTSHPPDAAACFMLLLCV